MAETKKNIMTFAGLRALEDELFDLKVYKRKEVAQKIKEAREQGDLSENAEYDAAVLYITSIVVIINFLVDVLYQLADPRVRTA